MTWIPLHVTHGYRLLFAYLSLPPELYGTYMCGSGRPFRFCDLDGTVYDRWQQPVVMYDDASTKQAITTAPEKLAAAFEKLLTETIDLHHTALGMLSHPLSFAGYSRPLIERCLDSLRAAGAPLLNADEWLWYQDRRGNVVLQQIGMGYGRTEVCVSAAGARSR